MAICVDLVPTVLMGAQSVWRSDTAVPIPYLVAPSASQVQPCGQYTMLTGTEYQVLPTLPTIQSLFDTYFLFDANTFALITGSVLVAYITGHVVGAVIKIMGWT